MSAKTPVKGHTSKHVHKTVKHSKAKGKHHPSRSVNPVPTFKVVPPHVIGKPAAHPKPRGFAVGDVLPACAFEAVAQSLRLAGQRVTDDDVAGLWELYGEVSIPEALAVFGLANVPHPSPGRGEGAAESNRLGAGKGPLTSWAVRRLERLDATPVNLPVILGVDVPGPHAVLATADGWWSWGELYSPWPCRIEEAWAVSWS